MVRDLNATLLSGRTVWIRFQGPRIYRGKAAVHGLECWSGDHPDLLAELEESDAN